MAYGQRVVIYDETKVPHFVLPEVLKCVNGQQVTDSTQWLNERRPELLKTFTEQIYGEIPGDLKITSYKIIEEGLSTAYSNTYRQQIKVSFRKNSRKLDFTILLYTPTDKQKVPVFLSANFFGNHAITNDKNVIVSKAWAMNNPDYHIANNTFTEVSRGARADRWSVQQIINAGYGLATFYYGEIDPDKDDLSDGIQPFFYKKGQTHPAENEWGSVAVWSWGISRAMDYLEMNKRVDTHKVILMGHSRLGKASLWAGANDKRFAAVISNNSGAVGAALSMRCFGERIDTINAAFPHWFCENFKKYNNRESELPVDQHELLALIAPRPVYVASAQDDLWADPKGEFLSAYYATPVYKLFGKTGIFTDQLPEIHKPIHNTVAYHIRAGVHYVTDYDWQQYIKWAEEVVFNSNAFHFNNNKVIAHRGAWKNTGHPQNSLSSLNAAVELGCSGSEFDIRLTANDSIVVNHDSHFQGLKIDSVNYADLLTMQLNNGEKISTLREYLSEGMKQKHTKLIIDLKNQTSSERTVYLAEMALKQIAALGAELWVEFLVSDLKAADYLNRHPNIPVAYLGAYSKISADMRPDKIIARGIKYVDYRFIHFQSHPEWIQTFKSAGVHLNAWTVNDTKEMQWFLSHDFDYITTDEPEALLKL